MANGRAAALSTLRDLESDDWTGCFGKMVAVVPPRPESGMPFRSPLTEVHGCDRSIVHPSEGQMNDAGDVTRILSAAEAGDPRAAAELLPLVYDELRKLAASRMASERSDHTLQATALVHEA